MAPCLLLTRPLDRCPFGHRGAERTAEDQQHGREQHDGPGAASLQRLDDEDDDEDESLLGESSREVAQIFTRIARAVRLINDERANLPDISDTDPQRLSFLVAAAMEVDTDVKQELLELRLTSERLRRLRDMLARAVTGYEERARVHEIAKGNGHSGRKIEIE